MNSTHLALLALALAGSFVYIYNTEAEKTTGNIIYIPNAPGVSFQVVLQPNQPQSMSNPLFSFTTCSCTASMTGGPNNVQGIVTKGSATWNGTPVPAAGLVETLSNG